MKMRQRLAAVLAATMILSAVPVVTMAASSSYPVKVVTVAKDGSFTTDLVIDVKNETTAAQEQIVYLELAGAKFDTATLTTGSAISATVTVQGDSTVKVVLPANVPVGKIGLTLGVKSVSADQVTVKVDGSATKAIDDTTVILANQSTSKAAVKLGDAVDFDGTETVTLKDITIEEPFQGVFGGKDVTITLDNNNYEFDNIGSVEINKGLAGVTSIPVVKNDGKQLKITIPNGSTSAPGNGKVTLKGVTVKCVDKKAATEDIHVTVAGDKVTETSGTVAKVVTYGGVFKLSDKTVDVTAGSKSKVKVKLTETLAESFRDGREVEFLLDKGYLTAAPADTTAIRKDNKATEKIIGFAYTIPTSTAKLDKEFELEVNADLGTTGDVTVTATGTRAIGADQKLVVATIKQPFTVKTSAIAAKAGVKEQKGGTITITEEAAGKIGRGTFQIVLDKEIEFTDKAEFKVTAGDLVIDKVEVDSTTKSILNVTVSRGSKTASTIEIKNFPVKVTSNVANGNYSVTIKGSTLGAGEIKADKFVVVGNTTAAGPNKVEFVIDAAKYVADGKEVTMDAAAFSQNGSLMVPVRFVANAFGIADENIKYAGGVVTLVVDGKIFTFEVGSNMSKLNGLPYAENTVGNAKTVLKGDRVYVSARLVAETLGGYDVSYADGVATFAKK